MGRCWDPPQVSDLGSAINASASATNGGWNPRVDIVCQDGAQKNYRCISIPGFLGHMILDR